MTSPDETIALKSPPFVMSPGFQTANNDLFGGLSGQQSNTGKRVVSCTDTFFLVMECVHF